MYETYTFCPDPANLEDWLCTDFPTDRFLEGNEGYIGGFEARMEAYGRVELVAIISPAVMPVGST